MPELTLLCSRPHVKDVDFARARFIVSTVQGLLVDGIHLEMGDEVPPGALSAYALTSEYDATRRIETIDHAMTLPHLREACARRGVTVEATPKPEVFVPDINELSLAELVDLCGQYDLGVHGNRKQLLARLRSYLESKMKMKEIL